MSTHKYISKTFYAKWIKVNYELNGGNWTSTYNAQDFAPYQRRLPVNTYFTKYIERTGYDFEGWFYTPDFTGKNEEYYDYSTENYYAKWKAKSYYIYYYYSESNRIDESAWKNSKPKTQFTIEDEVVLPTAEDFPLRGFVGWYTDKNLTGTPITTIPKGTTKAIYLYAKWIPEQALNFQISIDSIDDSTMSVSSNSDSTTFNLFYDCNNTYKSILWKLDGQIIKQGSSYNVTINKDELEVGFHNLLVVATDNDDKLYSSSVSFTVQK